MLYFLILIILILSIANMKYLDNQHRILKYLCKFRYGVIKAHKKCLVNAGEDIKKIEKKEVVPYSDAVVDMEKLKNLFAEREVMTIDDFNTALNCLVSDGHFTEDYIVTKTGKEKNKEMFNDYYNSDEFKKSLEEDNLKLEDLTNLAFK